MAIDGWGIVFHDRAIYCHLLSMAFGGWGIVFMTVLSIVLSMCCLCAIYVKLSEVPPTKLATCYLCARICAFYELFEKFGSEPSI